MKSLVSNVHLVAVGLLADARLAYPSLVGEFGRDERSLASYVTTRGLGFYTLDLPSLGSLLLEGLENERLVLSGPVSKPVSKRVRVPRLFRGLWLRVFDNSGSLRLDPDPTAVAFLRQLADIGKKETLSCTDARNKAAVKEFVDVERTTRPPTLCWSDDELFMGHHCRSLSFAAYGRVQCVSAASDPALFEDDLGRLSEKDAHFLERLDSICRDVSTGYGLLDPVTYERDRLLADLPSGTKNGPGAVSDRTSKQEKFCFDYWPTKLQNVFPIAYFGHRPSEQGKRFTNLEHPSKLILVPKTAKTPRLIASEPSYHQWCQQLVKAFLEERTPDVFGPIISFRDQSKSHPLVRLGSQDKSLATVDLSAASDRLSCWAIERAFAWNTSLLNAFKACRTRVIGPSKGVDIDFSFLRKFSTMGSALTFPVQSIFFACVVLAVLPGRPTLKSQLKRWGNHVRVYGDDIVIPATGYADLVRVLEILGLKVNRSKSFTKGNFRESCGYDAFLGHDVTPIKPRSLDPTHPEGRASIIELSNNLFLMGYWKASEAARSILPESTLRGLPVVDPLSGAVGLVSYLGTRVKDIPVRYNERIQQYEARCTTFISRAETTQTDGTDYSYQALHAMTFRQDDSVEKRDNTAILKWLIRPPNRAGLGRVIKAVTRERRSWVVFDDWTVFS